MIETKLYSRRNGQYVLKVVYDCTLFKYKLFKSGHEKYFCDL